MDRWLTVKEAAPLLSMKPYQIYRAIREEIFPFEYTMIGKQIRICLSSSSENVNHKEIKGNVSQSNDVVAAVALAEVFNKYKIDRKDQQKIIALIVAMCEE